MRRWWFYGRNKRRGCSCQYKEEAKGDSADEREGGDTVAEKNTEIQEESKSRTEADDNDDESKSTDKQSSHRLLSCIPKLY